jgi:predicted MFS family arabinose efflux permease
VKESAYKDYLLAVLLSLLAFNVVDRLALGLVLQDIKTDLQLSDTYLGLLSGVAFALFYSVMGIPIARWADRGNRVTVIGVTTSIWTVMVALCGTATNFVQLVLIRIGVAIGEAGCVPPAHSLIADHFSRAERPRAVAMFMLGGALSGVIGYFFAGWLAELFGWRTMFVLLSLPGVVLAPLAWLTLREPRLQRALAAEPRSADPRAAVSEPQPRFWEVCWEIWRNRTLRHLLFFSSIASFFAYGIGQWQPAFFIRNYNLATGELGTWFAVIHGGGGLLGTYLGGELASRRAANNEVLQLKTMALAYCSFAALAVVTYMTTSRYVAFASMGLAAMGGTATTAPLFAMIQTLVAPRMRATSIAILSFMANLIGMGLGPLMVGMLSDSLGASVGAESLRYALLAMSPGYCWGAWHLWRASRTVSGDVLGVERAHAESCANKGIALNSST